MGLVDPYAQALLDALDAAVGPWVEVQLTTRLRRAARPVDPGTVEAAARSVAVEAHERLAVLLATDVDQQQDNPLAILRSVARHATGVLADAGVPAPHRDEVARRLLPDDVFDLGPAAWRDLGDDVHEAGIAWGASKAMEHLRRRKGTGSQP